MASNYPPGVSGNEPQITGVWNPLELVSHVQEETKKARNILEEVTSLLDDQGALSTSLDTAFEEVDGGLKLIIEQFDQLLPPDEPDEEDWGGGYAQGR